MLHFHHIIVLAAASVTLTWAFDSSEIRLLENQFEKRSGRYNLYQIPDDELAEEKRSAYSSPLIRFGKRSPSEAQWTRDARNSMMGSPLIRFGKRSPDAMPLIRFGRSPAAPLIRFGRSPAAAPLIRFGKRAPYSAPHIRFGKRSEDDNGVIYRSPFANL
ncbi:CRE-FLP-13 protein [Aphelenchoides avenae]|nr:CRE-FLP-13 protein [Aphelenchus avenae]